MIKYKRLTILNRYYRITRFYPFIKGLAFKGLLSIIALFAIVFLIDYYLIDLKSLLYTVVANYPKEIVFSLFLASETLLGLLPPELFIAWSSKSAFPWLYLFILASLSYLGGILAYFFGKQLYRLPKVRDQIENKLSTHIKNLKKWGGFFVFIGAMLPIPHSIVSFASGLIQYNFKYYLLWALFRYLRFLIYAVIIFKII